MVTKNSLALPTMVKGIHGMIYSMFWAFVPVFLISKGYSGFEIGLFIGLANLMAIISILPAGVANDRIKSKKIVIYSLFFSIIYFFGLLTVENSIILAVAFVLGGIGRNLFNISIDSLAFRKINAARSSIQMGKFLSITAGFAILGFLIGGNAINTFGYDATIIGIITLLIVTLITAFFLPITATYEAKLFEYKKDIFKKEVLIFILITFLFTLHFGAEATSYSPFLQENFGLNLSEIGFFIAGANLFLIISHQIFSRKIQKGFDPKKVFYFGLIVAGLGHILFSIQSDVWLSFIFRCMHELGDGAMFFSIYYGIVKIFNIERIGGNSSIITLTTVIGSSTGAFIFGPLGAEYGYYLPLFITGITNLIAFVILYSFNKKY
jgi:MFS family permease